MAIRILGGTKETAEFSEAQKVALRTHILPSLKEVTDDAEFGEEYVKVFNNKNGFYTPTGEKASDLHRALASIEVIVESIVGTSSPTKRAASLKRILQDYATSKQKSIQIVNLLKHAQKLAQKIPPKDLTPKGQQAVAVFNKPFFKLLAKSWKFIIQECEVEHSEIVKKYKLLFVTNKGNKAQVNEILKKLKTVLPDWSPFTGEYDREGLISPDKLKYILAYYNEWGHGDDYALIPGYRMSESDPWYSWMRRGIDEGQSWFDTSTSIQEAVETVLEKIDTAMEKRKALDTNGQDYSLGPISKKMLPQEFDALVEKLKSGKMHTFGSGGFGTYYTFTTKKPSHGYGDKQGYADLLSEKVGKPVYWFSEFRD